MLTNVEPDAFALCAIMMKAYHLEPDDAKWSLLLDGYLKRISGKYSLTDKGKTIYREIVMDDNCREYIAQSVFVCTADDETLTALTQIGAIQ